MYHKPITKFLLKIRYRPRFPKVWPREEANYVTSRKMALPLPKRARVEGDRKVCMVTGGTGMVGKAIEHEIKAQRPEGEKWIFLSRKDADLR